MLKLIVFDCDGVMFDSRLANQQYYNHLLAHFHLPPMDEEELEYVHMYNAVDSVKYIFRKYPHADFAEIEKFRKELSYESFLQYMTMEGDLVEFLETVKNSYHLAISTNRANTMIPLLKTFNLDGYYDKVVTSETATRPKPAPDGLIEILEYFNCSPDEAIFIGDSIIDRDHTASCKVALIAFKNASLPAEYHVNSFMEIFSLPPFQQQG